MRLMRRFRDAQESVELPDLDYSELNMHPLVEAAYREYAKQEAETMERELREAQAVGDPSAIAANEAYVAFKRQEGPRAWLNTWGYETEHAKAYVTHLLERIRRAEQTAADRMSGPFAEWAALSANSLLETANDHRVEVQELMHRFALTETENGTIVQYGEENTAQE